MSLSAVTSGARRANALMRDEQRVRSLTALEGPTYDARTDRLLRTRLADLLETVRAIVDDDEFWAAIATSAAALDDERFEGLLNLDGATLAQLLELAGYEAPPPPTAEELVGDTVTAISSCLARYAAGWDTREAVATLRSDLSSLLYRVRRQVLAVTGQAGEQDEHRAAGRRLVRVARALIPPVVGVAFGAPVELLLPGTGLGVLAGAAAAQKAVEMCAEWAAASALGHDWTSDDDEPSSGGFERRGPVDDPLLVHTTALVDDLGQLIGRDTKYSRLSPERRDALIADAFIHASRLEDLAEDGALAAADDPMWSELAHALASTQAQARVLADGGVAEQARLARAVVFRIQDHLLKGDDHNAGRFG